MTSEGKIKDEIKKFLKSIGAWFYMPVSYGYGRVGLPDFLVCYNGRFIAIEVKAPGKKYTLTPNQKREIDAIHIAGGNAIIVDNLDEVKKLFYQ